MDVNFQEHSQHGGFESVAPGIPLLDNHNEASVLGRVVDVWFAGRKLCGTLQFDRTRAGRDAEEKVRRSEIVAVSSGSNVTDWRDDNGDIAYPFMGIPNRYGRVSNDHFTAGHWQLVEVSLVKEPSDPMAVII